MEEQQPEDLCSHCHNKKYLKGFPNKLCEDCRQAFIQYPIPRWIWLFAGGILVVMIISMIRLPKSLPAAIDLSRAESAMAQKRYYTAQRELNRVLEVFPHNAHANALLLISSAYNWDLTTARDTYDKVANKTLDNDVLKQIDVALLNFDNVFPVDTNLIPHIERIKDNPDSLKLLFAEADSVRGPDFLFTGRFIAEKLFDRKDYQDAEIMLQEVLNESPDYYPALSLMAATKRNTGDYEGALAVCDRLLNVNKEDIGIVTQKARIELKRRQLKAAQVYVDQAMSIDPEQTVAMEAQAMLYYYGNKKPEALKVLQAIKNKEKDTGDTVISDRLEPILNGTVIY